MRVGIELLAVDEEAELLPVAGGIGFRRGRREGDRATVGDFDVLDGCERRRAATPGSFMSIGSPDTTTLASGPTGDGWPWS